MKFFAHVNPESDLHALWRREDRVKGWSYGITFNWNSDRKWYESQGELPKDRIETIRNNANFVLEAHSTRIITTETDPVTGEIISETSREKD